MENFGFLKTNNLVLGLMIIGLVFWASNVQNTGPLKTFAVPEISIVDAVTAIARGATVIDVRGRDAYETGHIPNAISVPLDELRRRAAEFAAVKDKEFVIYCGDGSTLGPQGTQVLTDAGHPATKNLEGGLPGWKAAGQPVAAGAR